MKLNSGRYGMLPYEKCLRYGPESLSDTELMAIILRSGTTGSNCIEIALGLASIQICGGRALNFLGGVKAYRRISNSECRVIDYRESDCTR